MSVRLHHGDCRDVLATLPDASVDAVVTDPPYELTGNGSGGFMGKAWDATGVAYDVGLWAEVLRVLKPGGHLLAFGGTRTYHRMTVAIEDAGFEVRDSLHWLYGSGFPKSLDVSKAIDKINGEPDRLLRFTLWFRTTGFTVKQVTTMLRDAGLITENGTMAGHYFAKAHAGQPAIPTAAMWAVIRPHVSDVPEWVDELVARIEAEREVVGTKTSGIANKDEGARHTIGASQAVELDITAPATDAARQWEGWGTALKPAHEPIVVARKPLVGTVAANVLAHGTGALNIDGCRVGFASEADEQESKTKNQHADFGTEPGGNKVYGDYSMIPRTNYNPPGRWPANLVFTHAAECGEACADGCPVAELDGQSGVSRDGVAVNRNGHDPHRQGYNKGWGTEPRPDQGYGGQGGASRFFTVTEWDPIADVAPFRYVAKPSKRERNAGLDGLEAKREADRTKDDGAGGDNPRNRSNTARVNHHPTVKPVALMRWLVRLVTPPGGTVLDPFAGSGTTLAAAVLEHFNAIGIEMTDDYLPIINGRVAWAEEQAQAQPATLFSQEAS